MSVLHYGALALARVPVPAHRDKVNAESQKMAVILIGDERLDLAVISPALYDYHLSHWEVI